MEEPTLSDAVFRDFARSGISKETVAKLKIRSAKPTDLQYYTHANLIESSYLIPYLNPDLDYGKYKVLEVDKIPYSRIRVLESRDGIGGLEIPKYLQRKGTGTHVYFPPLVEPGDWYNVHIPLVITEGEKKAVAASQSGLLCCAIAGVDSW
jgi:hypothetical protein